MKTYLNKCRKPDGSALILVVVVTVLLAVVGVMFMMVSRAAEMETAAVIQAKDLENAVDTVVAKINEVLVEDLFDASDDFVSNAYNSTTNNPWLADLEPKLYDDNGTPDDPTDNIYVWPRITDLYGNNFGIPPIVSLFDPQSRESDISNIDIDERNGSISELRVDAADTLVKIIRPKDRTYAVDSTAPDVWATEYAGARADADGDGVADSRWVQVPSLTTSRGEPVFAAVRIIDNCAMLNLNVAHCFYQTDYSDDLSPFEKRWFENETTATPYHDNKGTGSGRYLTEINYLPFLRGQDLNGNFFAGTAGGDFWYNLMQAKGFWDTDTGLPVPPRIAQHAVMNIESAMPYQFFGVDDELEIRNRYLLTSKTEARFERADVANFTLDSGGGVYSALQMPRDGTNDFDAWIRRINPANFDKWDISGNIAVGTFPYRYDRRHVCTFYSFDRDLPTGDFPLLDDEFDLLASDLGWTEQFKEQARKIFWPVGPATTNIQTPFISYEYDDDDSASILYPYAGFYNNVETRRKILHLLFAFREYFYNQNGDISDAAKQAAQVVANLIDYSDDDAIVPTSPDRQGPFYDPDYGEQANVDCTFINEDIIDQLITEVSTAILGAPIPYDSSDFGFPPDEIVFGYEKQPFISEVYARRDPVTGQLQAFAIELLNPYKEMINLTRDGHRWRIKIGDGVVDEAITDGIFKNVPEYNTFPASPDDNSHGRYVIHWNASLATGPLPSLVHNIDELGSLTGGNNLEIQLLRPAPAESGHSFICADRVPSDDVKKLFTVDNQSAIKRNDEDWKFLNSGFIFQAESDGNYTHTLGQANNVSLAGESLQIAVADDGVPLTRWHELETLSLFGHVPENGDPNDVITSQIASQTLKHFNLAADSSDLLNYVTTINRPNIGSLPGRINVNTAPVHVIAAAIPPTLADPNAADPAETVTFSALQMAQEIVERRPYTRLTDFLTNVPSMKQYSAGGDRSSVNVGRQSIKDDIEEEHWVLSNLANKLTVRSDVFTAYILVRLGADGPQRRMIGIFDRSQVWDRNDRPKLVALHPVPDPR